MFSNPCRGRVFQQPAKDASDPFDLLSKKIGEMAEATTKRLEQVEAKADATTESVRTVEQQLARPRFGDGTPTRPDSWGEEFTKSQGDALKQLSESNRGRVALNVKATLTTGPASAGSLVEPARDATAIMPRRRMAIRDLLNVMQVESGTVE